MFSELPEKYVIVGPEDHNELVTFWNTHLGWVEYELASKYDERILAGPLPRETQYLIDAETFTQLTPLPGRGVKKTI